MKTFFAPGKSFFTILSFLLYSIIVNAQIGINTSSPANGALLDINSSDKGWLIPNVTLTATSDITTITPSATIGLLVYNTVTAGPLPSQVTPGFYYWNGLQWLRFYNQGYGILFDQTTFVAPDVSSSVYTPMPDFDTGVITIPYSGTYQIKVETAYSAGGLISTSSEGVGQGSVSLTMATNLGVPVRVKEVYVTSTSKRIGSTTINGLPQNITIVYTVDLDVLDVYQFAVDVREWSKTNVGIGAFGVNTSGYSGSTGITDAQNGSLSLILVKQQ